MLTTKIQSALAILALSALASFGCDESRATSGRQGQADTTTKTTSTPMVSNGFIPDPTVQGGGEFVGEVFAEPAPAPELPGQGEDNPEMFQQTGPFNGSWRVTTEDSTGKEVLRFSLTEGQDASALAGSFIMGDGMGQGFAGQVGEFSEGTSANDALSLSFNPTNDASDVWSLTTTERMDADRLRGSVSNVDGSLKKDVVIVRENPEENSGIRTPEG